MSKVNDLYEFMLEYQLEHAGEIVPPTLQQIANKVGLSKGMVFYHLQRLRRQGLVEKRSCGSRKYMAVMKVKTEEA